MNRIAALLILSLFTFSTNAQSVKDLSARISEIGARLAIKNVVDTFSILADQKDIQKQLLLFTEDATVTSIVQGQPRITLTGRKGKSSIKPVGPIPSNKYK